MLSLLDQASAQSLDPLEDTSEALLVAFRVQQTGQRGRPRLEFEPDFLAWPPEQLLRDPNVQAWLYRNLFFIDKNQYLPPERYQVRVLKPLMAKIEQSIKDPEDDVGYRGLYLIIPSFPLSLILAIECRRSRTS